MKAALLAVPTALLLSTGHCVSNHLHLDVTFYTQIAPDGGCSRRTEYRLTRLGERGKDDPGFERAPDEDPLRKLFRFPSGNRWTTTESVATDTHEVSLSAFLASANDLGGDYSRAGAGSARTQNHVSFSMSQGDYEYSELIVDTSNPIQAMGKLLDLEEEAIDTIAPETARRLEDRHLSSADIRDTYRTHCLLPLRRELDAIAQRPMLGPAERARLGKLLDSPCDEEVEAALLALSPGNPQPVHDAIQHPFKSKAFDEKLERSGVIEVLYPLFEDVDPDRLDVQFHATVVMPAPIVQANSCIQGDTAHWDFTQRDLYGRGFEMRVLARAPE